MNYPLERVKVHFTIYKILCWGTMRLSLHVAVIGVTLWRPLQLFKRNQTWANLTPSSFQSAHKFYLNGQALESFSVSACMTVILQGSRALGQRRLRVSEAQVLQEEGGRALPSFVKLEPPKGW